MKNRTRVGAAAAAPLLVAALAAAPAAAWGDAPAVKVAGVVVNHDGAPVEFANVTVPALMRGVVSDEQGRFALELPQGPATIEVTQIGYQRGRL